MVDLIARGLSHGYGDRAVLKDISFYVRSGEIVSVLGSSGSGKSTLLRILGGMEQPLAGTVSTRGTPAPGTLNPVTYVFQEFTLVPWLSVAENVALPLRHHPLSATERWKRVHSVLARVGLEEFANAHPKQLSGGMKQRVGIARAIAVEPAILLIDEPTSALDPHSSRMVLELLTSLWAQTGFTAVYVTHRLDEALRISHRVIVLSGQPSRFGGTVTIRTPIDGRLAHDPEILDARARIERLAKQDVDDRSWAIERDS